ncbi:PucR family transcriptional regulator [Petropleomorpha daqingensis]|uniref:DNA-binding transcriptional regulator, PucR family n=1 Tax=Petropleomorpha daqingensis TaxID=2026353 RepID=A0A853CCJ2_9ACTN|nr:hypothetical protein [Petropleomorpha daqingensis]
MSGPRHTGLRRVLDDLGATLLELLHGDPDAAPEIGGIAIHDPLDEPALPPHALVLGVGIGEPAQTVALLGQLGRRGAVGLVVRAPVVATTEVLAAADDAGVALLGLTRGATWSQLAAMLRAVLAEGDVVAGESESLGGLPSGDLFALANAVAALLDAPITIEDRSNRVLAFSGRQDETDRGREETVLGLQVPERYSRILTERGVFRELYRSDRPVIVDPVPAADGSGRTLPRAAIAVRAGDEVLGSIWAVLHEPLSAERADALCESAKLVALHLMRVRAGSDVQRRVRADLVSTALEGGAGAREALTRLALADQPVVVLALAVADAPAGEEATDAAAVSVRQRLADAFALHLSAVHPRSAAALVGHAAYGLVPVSGDDGEDRAARIAADFLDRVGDRVPASIGIGPVSRDVGGVAAARLAADRALRVLRERRSAARVARLPEVYVEALMLELRDLVAVRGDTPAGPVARLLEYDAAHGSRLVETLRAWLDAFGDVNAAAAGLFVHPNTFRYRLRRLAEVGGLDLDDPEARFAAQVQLRLL